jgi:catechol 2,3-dioxygenase-like lactoylglutathione lyase family enzyme
MGVRLAKDSIDLGIVVSDAERSLAFYRDTLGFKDDGTMPVQGGATMYRLYCGTSLIKLLHFPTRELPAAAPGGIHKALGYRYWTISVDNIQEVADACAAAGYKIPVAVVELRPGVSIAIIEDPDGNWVELVTYA